MSNPPSERKFGFTMAILLMPFAIYVLLQSRETFSGYALLVTSALLALVAAMNPAILSPLNRTWFAFGEMIGRVMNPAVLFFLFFGLIAPIAMISRLFGRDELRLRRRACHSYWIERTQPSPTADSFKNQF